LTQTPKLRAAKIKGFTVTVASGFETRDKKVEKVKFGIQITSVTPARGQLSGLKNLGHKMHHN